MNGVLALSLKGLAAILPLSLTLYFIYWLMSGAESLLLPYVDTAFYFPGMGIVIAVVLILMLGLLVNLFFIKWLVKTMNTQIERIPLVKSVYGAIRDILTVFKINEKDSSEAVVSIEIQPEMHLIGFVTAVQLHLSWKWFQAEQIPQQCFLQSQLFEKSGAGNCRK